MSRRFLLTDNGSLAPESTLQLRRLARELEARIDYRVDPVSLAHSAKIPAAELEGRPAEFFEAALDRGIREGVREFIVLPLFVGPSHAVTRQIPGLLAERRKQYSFLRSRVASPLFQEGDKRLATILSDHIREHISIGASARSRIAVVDHGSPNREVAEARDAIAADVRDLLGNEVSEVEACSMERREGSDYDFNEPLLESLLMRPAWMNAPVIVGLAFIAGGRHAGPEGDVEQICRKARGAEMSGLKITRVLGEHPLLLDILADRAAGDRATG